MVPTQAQRHANRLIMSHRAAEPGEAYEAAGTVGGEGGHDGRRL